MNYEARKKDGTVVAAGESRGMLLNNIKSSLPQGKDEMLVMWWGNLVVDVLMWAEFEEGSWELFSLNTESGTVTKI